MYIYIYVYIYIYIYIVSSMVETPLSGYPPLSEANLKS